jgi:hypothetical protein
MNTKIYGNVAVVEFNWDFVAVFRSSGQTLHTTGRESQVNVNVPRKGWRLVHVHYSGHRWLAQARDSDEKDGDTTGQLVSSFRKSCRASRVIGN